MNWSTYLRNHRGFKLESSGTGHSPSIASTEELLFVAKGKFLNCFPINPPKNDLKPKFKRLQSTLLNFDITLLKPNPNKKLLAVAGYDDNSLFRLVVIKIDFGETAIMTNPTCGLLEVTCISIAKDMIPYGYQQISWHPASPLGTVLVILDRVGVIRLFDTAVSCNTPEIILDLYSKDLVFNEKMVIERAYKLGLYGIEALNSEFPNMSEIPEELRDQILYFDFCSLNSSGWEAYSLIFITQFNQMYSVCPFIPNSCLANRENAAALAYEVLEEISAIKTEEEIEIDEEPFKRKTTVEKPYFGQHEIESEFLSLILNNPPSFVDPSLVSVNFNQDPTSKKFHPTHSQHLKGPNLFADKDITPNVVSFGIIPTSTAPITVRAFDNQLIVFSAIKATLRPTWIQLPKEQSVATMSDFVILDIFYLGFDTKDASHKYRVNIELDDIVLGHVYCLHDYGAHFIDASSLLKKMNSMQHLDHPPQPSPIYSLVENKHLVGGISGMVSLTPKHTKGQSLIMIDSVLKGCESVYFFLDKWSCNDLRNDIEKPRISTFYYNYKPKLNPTLLIPTHNPSSTSKYNASSQTNVPSSSNAPIISEDGSSFPLDKLKLALKQLEYEANFLNGSRKYYDERLSRQSELLQKLDSSPFGPKGIEEELSQVRSKSKSLTNSIGQTNLQIKNLKMRILAQSTAQKSLAKILP